MNLGQHLKLFFEANPDLALRVRFDTSINAIELILTNVSTNQSLRHCIQWNDVADDSIDVCTRELDYMARKLLEELR